VTYLRCFVPRPILDLLRLDYGYGSVNDFEDCLSLETLSWRSNDFDTTAPEHFRQRRLHKSATLLHFPCSFVLRRESLIRYPTSSLDSLLRLLYTTSTLLGTQSASLYTFLHWTEYFSIGQSISPQHACLRNAVTSMTGKSLENMTSSSIGHLPMASCRR
jgi:hypothetical protein